MSLENYTTYTEADANNRFTVASNKITVASLNRSDANHWVYYDKGVNFFDGDFNHKVQVKVTAQASGVLTPWCLSNTLDSLIPTTDNMWVDWNVSTFRLIEKVSSSVAVDISTSLSLNTLYYLTIIRDESIGSFGQLQCFIYSDSLRTTLVDTLTLALRNKADWRYVFGVVGYESGTGSISGEIENLDLGLVVSISGFPFFFNEEC